MLLALETNSNWSAAGEALNAAKKQPWFPYMRIPPRMTAPPPMLAILRAALIYDPTATLQRVRNRRSHCSERSTKTRIPLTARRGFARRQSNWPEGPDHIDSPRSKSHVGRSMTGYEGDPSLPKRTVEGYPEAIIRWLDASAELRTRVRGLS
jgi:hypothetical protein